MLRIVHAEESGSTRASEVYTAIRTDILSCKLRPGQKLRTDAMKLEYGVSASPIREAVSRLASEGLIELVDKRGARVAEVSEADLRDLLIVREHVESLALEWSIDRGDEQWEADVVGRFHVFKNRLKRGSQNISDDLELQERHEAFHLGLVAACGSPRLLQIIQTLYVQTRCYRIMADYGRPADSEVISEHEAIMEAALARQPDSACHLFRRHASKTIDLALGNLALLSGSDPESGQGQG